MHPYILYANVKPRAGTGHRRTGLHAFASGDLGATRRVGIGGTGVPQSRERGGYLEQGEILFQFGGWLGHRFAPRGNDDRRGQPHAPQLKVYQRLKRSQEQCVGSPA